MPIFISHSHRDAEFVDKLALQLVQQKVAVWLDRWELNVGDSLLSRIQGAITGASALLVVLSRASVDSEWVTKEINAGLIRELEEKRTIVLPVLVETCEIPIFLRDKLYADFRSDFDVGLKRVVESVARIANASAGRIDAPTYDTDWGMEWGLVDDRVFVRLTLIERAVDQPFSLLGLVEIHADEAATIAHLGAVSSSTEDEANLRLVDGVAAAAEDVQLILTDQYERRVITVVDFDRGTLEVAVSARRLGADTGRDVLYRAGERLGELARQMSEVLRRPDQN